MSGAHDAEVACPVPGPYSSASQLELPALIPCYLLSLWHTQRCVALTNTISIFQFRLSIEEETYATTNISASMASFPGSSFEIIKRCGNSVHNFSKHSVCLAVSLFLILGIVTSTFILGDMRIPVDKVMECAATRSTTTPCL